MCFSIHTGVYTGRIYAGMSQQVSQMAQILRRFVIQTGEQVTKVVGKNLAHRFHHAVIPAHILKKAIDRGQHGIRTGRRIAVYEPLLIVDHQFLGNLAASGKSCKSTDVPPVFLNGDRAFCKQNKGIILVKMVPLLCLFCFSRPSHTLLFPDSTE